MKKLFIEDLKVEGKKVLLRVDFNVPLDDMQNVADATRIEAALPSINYVLQNGGSLILMSHMGRPKGVHCPELSLAPCAKFLSGLLKKSVQMAPDSIGHVVKDMASKLQKGEILLLENLRFHLGEEKDDRDFAKELASLGDLYVNDAFAVCHRKQASVYAITEFFKEKAAAGYLLAKEVKILRDLFSEPKRPLHALIGGAKISSKIGALKTLIKHVDTLLIGGAMSYTFLKAKGFNVGKSLVENDFIGVAKEILQEGKKVVLPIDAVIADRIEDDATIKTVTLEDGIEPTFMGLDIGPKTIDLFKNTLSNAKTILWNGPVGVFELAKFSKGTFALAKTIAASDALTVVGGGDSIAALNEADVVDKITHISTGGGATLEFIENQTLPAIEVLSEPLKIKAD